jgi:hypothetical protein
LDSTWTSKVMACQMPVDCENDLIGRYILRFRGPGSTPPEDVRLISSVPGARVIDQSDRVLLVEAPDGELRQLVSGMSRWVIGEERRYPLPNSRPKPN